MKKTSYKWLVCVSSAWVRFVLRNSRADIWWGVICSYYIKQGYIYTLTSYKAGALWYVLRGFSFPFTYKIVLAVHEEVMDRITRLKREVDAKIREAINNAQLDAVQGRAR